MKWSSVLKLVSSIVYITSLIFQDVNEYLLMHELNQIDESYKNNDDINSQVICRGKKQNLMN